MAIRFTGNADVDFVASMIPHHQGAVEMAKSPRIDRKVHGLLQCPEATSEPEAADAGSGLIQRAAAIHG
jgi:Domain of unknown function (DUF305)